MTTLTLGDFLDRELAFRTRLNAYYAGVREGAADNGVRLLTYCLAGHRGRLAAALAGLPAGTAARAREAPFLCGGPYDPEAELRLPAFRPDAASGAELAEDAAVRQGRLAARCRFMLARSPGGDARAVLEALARVAERDAGLMRQLLSARYFEK